MSFTIYSWEVGFGVRYTKSLMHLFVRQYEKMQFDRDSAESYQEKRMKQVSWTFVMYSVLMFRSREYIARHIKIQSRENWCKNEFVVSVSESADEFQCEFGMLSTMRWFTAKHLRS